MTNHTDHSLAECLARSLQPDDAHQNHLAPVIGCVDCEAKDPGAWREDNGETCPRCHAVNWGQTPDGRDECASCGYVGGAR